MALNSAKGGRLIAFTTLRNISELKDSSPSIPVTSAIHVVFFVIEEQPVTPEGGEDGDKDLEPRFPRFCRLLGRQTAVLRPFGLNILKLCVSRVPEREVTPPRVGYGNGELKSNVLAVRKLSLSVPQGNSGSLINILFCSCLITAPLGARALFKVAVTGAAYEKQLRHWQAARTISFLYKTKPFYLQQKFPAAKDYAILLPSAFRVHAKLCNATDI